MLTFNFFNYYANLKLQNISLWYLIFVVIMSDCWKDFIRHGEMLLKHLSHQKFLSNLCVGWNKLLISMHTSLVFEKLLIELTNHGRISSVGRALDCRAGGRGFNSRGRTNTQGLKITEK